MSIRKIIELPLTELHDRESILRKHADEVIDFGAETQAAVLDLVDTFEAHSIAVGLAAPQIGINKRIIVVNLSKNKTGPHTILINPRFVELSSQTITGYESCMSIPHYRGKVKRSQTVRIAYFDQHGTSHEVDAHDFVARVFQHEVDHLNGILYTDLMSGSQLEETDLFEKDKPHSSE